nr:ATP-dependent metallopeptidase FtsH/Yme1/Tma family protein [Lachnospiraceae bacterium]
MDNNNNQNNHNNGQGDPKGPRIAPMLVAALVLLLLVTYFTRALSSPNSREIPYTEFIQMLDDGKVESVYVESDRITITPKEDEVAPLPFRT